ncbi:centrosomal protein of 192 kDa-like isoform X3 [Cynocephalus volans]
MKSQHLSHALMKQLAFQSDVARTEEERAKTTGSLQGQDLFDRVLPLDQIQDSPVDFCLLSWMNNKEHKIVVSDTGKHFEDKTPNSDLSHASLLENEKLMSLTSLEDSSDDDIDDEMFYDDHLEAYFEQLAIPGMVYEDLGGQEPPEEDFKLLTSDPSQPSFGYFIRSPEKREPIALIRKSDVSRSNLEKGMAHFTHDQFSGDLNEQSPAQLNEGSITLQVEALESNSQVDENDVTLTADKGKTESDITSELSTTIIQASPAPSEEQAGFHSPPWPLVQKQRVENQLVADSASLKPVSILGPSPEADAKPWGAIYFQGCQGHHSTEAHTASLGQQHARASLLKSAFLFFRVYCIEQMQIFFFFCAQQNVTITFTLNKK